MAGEWVTPSSIPLGKAFRERILSIRVEALEEFGHLLLVGQNKVELAVKLFQHESALYLDA